MGYKPTPPKDTGMKRWLDPAGKQMMVMTVEGVGDFKIMKDESTLSPITTWDGKPIHWPRIRTLTLEGDMIVFGCGECDYVAKSASSVRPHLNRHRDKPAKTGPDASLVDNLLDVVHRADTADRRIEKLRGERDEWKRRAVQAESDLAVLKRVLGR